MRLERVASLVVLLIGPTVHAQSPDSGELPHTAWGRPDLNGVWDFRTITPLERPDTMAGKVTLSEEEAASFEQGFARIFAGDELFPSPGTTAADFELWADGMVGTRLSDRRTSLIVDPPDGRIPARTATGEQRMAATINPFLADASGYEDRTWRERCLYSRVPVVPSAGPNFMQLFQTEHYVALLQEESHDVRLIPLDSRVAWSTVSRQWQGNSRGYWDGTTLVAETINFDPRTSIQGSGPSLRLVERFTRVDTDTMRYEFTINDPESFTEPWSAVVSMRATDDQVWEYACHEGNYSMPLILGTARVLERR